MEHKKLLIPWIPKQFNDGLFWGNGRMGGLLYAVENSLRFSIDHQKLWEIRDSTADMPGAKFQDFVNEPEKFHNGTFFQQPLITEPRIWRTRLPGLSLDVTFTDKIIGFYGDLDFSDGSSKVCITLENHKEIKLQIYLDANVNVLKIALDTKEVKIQIKGWNYTEGQLTQLAVWGYQSYRKEIRQGVTHVIQPYSGCGLAAISLVERPNEIYIAMNAELAEGEEILVPENAFEEQMIAENEDLLEQYLAKEPEFFKAHQEAYQRFWNSFDLQIPNDRLQHAFYLEMYKIFANERRDIWPVALQGIWNNDVRMPAWCGDFHNDLNVQSCYWAAFKTNHIEFAESYIDFYAKAMSHLEERAFKLYGKENTIAVPVMMAPGGYGAGGEWCYWNCLLGPELFIATDFCWYYEYSKDSVRLETIIYPFVEKVLNLYQRIAFEKEDGFLHIPFTNSPEVFKDGQMLIREDGTFVIATLHYLLDHMIQYAALLGKNNKEYTAFQKKLISVKITEKGYPLFPEEEVFESHRHFCHLFPLFPLGMDAHSVAAAQSLDTIIDQGLTEYAAWSFPYLAILAARCGRGNMARTMLELYCMAFRAKNSFVVNGDPNRNGILRVSETNAGESSDTFTVEAGFILPAALSEMFVHRAVNTIYIAYGIPEEWEFCSCKNMTIEGGHKISVEIEHFEIKSVTIEANYDETVQIKVARVSRELKMNGKKLEGLDCIAIELKKGTVVTFCNS